MASNIERQEGIDDDQLKSEEEKKWELKKLINKKF
jgi:hypothetical protein